MLQTDAFVFLVDIAQFIKQTVYCILVTYCHPFPNLNQDTVSLDSQQNKLKTDNSNIILSPFPNLNQDTVSLDSQQKILS